MQQYGQPVALTLLTTRHSTSAVHLREFCKGYITDLGEAAERLLEEYLLTTSVSDMKITCKRSKESLLY